MTHVTDFFYESGMTDRLEAVGQIGVLLQALNIQTWQDYGGRNFYSIGLLIEKTINDLLECVEDLDEKQRDEFMALKAQIPPDPEKIAAGKAHCKELALYMIDKTRFVSAETAEAIKQVIEAAEEFQGLTSTDEKPAEDE